MSSSLEDKDKIREVLAKHGVTTSWNGSVDSRIVIEPFEWRKRRWSDPPKSRGGAA